MLVHEDGTLPTKGEIFCFGSNLAGRHGAGAARMALQYGAVYGNGVGIQGNTYAIPTKDKSLKVLPIAIIQAYVRAFIAYTKKHDDKFFITRIGCGLAGYSDSDIAPLFKGIGDNCSVSSNWELYLRD